MDVKKFVLSYYADSSEFFHIHRVEFSTEAQKPHTHEYYQIYFITRGSLVHYVGADSSRLGHGDMFIIPPGTVHRITPGPDTVFYSLSFMPAFLLPGERTYRVANSFLKSLESDPDVRPGITVPPSEIMYVESIMAHILDEFSRRPLGSEENLRSYTAVLVTMLARNYFEAGAENFPNVFDSDRSYVMHCIEYINSSYSDKITLEDMYRRSAMSRSAFCSLFRRLTGSGFNAYLNGCRIRKACDYMLRGYNATAVYGLCGYNDFSTFHRNFKKITGMTPAQFKKETAERQKHPSRPAVSKSAKG